MKKGSDYCRTYEICEKDKDMKRLRDRITFHLRKAHDKDFKFGYSHHADHIMHYILNYYEVKRK